MEKKVLIVDLLKESLDKYKELVSNNLYMGMCNIITHIFDIKFDIFLHKSYPTIIESCIPEFNKLFLKVKTTYYDPYWWDRKDTVSRVKAFEKLINYYSLSENKEKCIKEKDLKSWKKLKN